MVGKPDIRNIETADGDPGSGQQEIKAKTRQAAGESLAGGRIRVPQTRSLEELQEFTASVKQVEVAAEHDGLAVGLDPPRKGLKLGLSRTHTQRQVDEEEDKLFEFHLQESPLHSPGQVDL